jgi:hypothetical protein
MHDYANEFNTCNGLIWSKVRMFAIIEFLINAIKSLNRN